MKGYLEERPGVKSSMRLLALITTLIAGLVILLHMYGVVFKDQEFSMEIAGIALAFAGISVGGKAIQKGKE